ncbi:hypothetical protein V8E51_011095 [Hyaloscypha variabilis]
MNKAPSFTPRGGIPSPTTSTRHGSSGPSTYAPSVADSTASPPSTTTTATPLPWKRRTGRGSAGYVPPAAASPLDISGTGQHRLVIGIDYGTTFTGIAWATPDADRADLDDISVLTKWSPKMDNDVKIPSVISYSPRGVDDEEQFGYDISPDAITMVNTKLELEPQDERVDELNLILQVLDGIKNLNFDHVKSIRSFPGYTWKGPEEVVTDYLTKAFACFDAATEYMADLKPTIPVDIVVTTPVAWSYKAKNSTIRAIRHAGFNERNFPNLQRLLLVTEPEAAAIYTAQYLKQQEAELLREKECFVLCDAGGGTVDVVAYKVMQVEPNLQLEAITIPTGAKCGASFINANFREWLREVLGERNYTHLDPLSDSQRINAQAMETAEMRLLMSKFEVAKKIFCADSDDVELDLPAPLHTLNIPGRVEQGSLTVSHAEMKSFFDPCVDDIIELIDGQIAQVEARKNRVKSIFLVGGFSESGYLREELDRSINKLRNMKIRLPATSWSAVVQGAVLFGMEKANRQTQATVKPCPKSYGISLSRAYTKRLYSEQDKETSAITNQTLAKGQLTWFIRKGDILQLNKTRIIQEELYWNFVEGQQRYVTLPIYEYLDDDRPMRFENAHEELKTVATFTADLNSISLLEMEKFKNPTTGISFYQACLICKWTVTDATLKGELLWGEKVMSAIVLQNIDQL